jgi:hypothetical protein
MSNSNGLNERMVLLPVEQRAEAHYLLFPRPGERRVPNVGTCNRHQGFRAGYRLYWCLIAPVLLAALVSAAADSPAPAASASSPQATTNAAGSVTLVASTIPDAKLKLYAARPPKPVEGEGWQVMFDGKSLAGWKVTDFDIHGPVECRSGLMVLHVGTPFTGVNWTNKFPDVNYEVTLEAMRVEGPDFFCGLTVPVRDSFCSLIVGGWGGSLVGISSLDDLDASENETTNFETFEKERWFQIRLRVTEKKIQAWIDDHKLIDVDITDKRISLRPGDIELSKPFGLATWDTAAVIREVKMRPLKN